MKKIIIGIAMAVCFTMGFAISGSQNNASSGQIPTMKIEKAFASENTPNTMALDNQPARDASIFSWTMILYLSAAVIVIVTFRRNTCV